MKVFVLHQLINLIKTQKIVGEDKRKGDLYGLEDNYGNLFVISCCLNLHQLQHDPTLLLPSSFQKVGILNISTKSNSQEKLASSKNEVVINYASTEKDIEVFMKTDDGGLPLKIEYEICYERNLYDSFIMAKVNYRYEFLSPDKTADVKNFVNKCKEDALSKNTFFRMRSKNILIQNNGEGNAISDEIGSLFSSSKKKQPEKHFDFAIFDLMLNKSNGLSTAPVAQIDFNKVKILHSSLEGEAVLYIPKDVTITNVGMYLAKSVAHQVQLSEYWLVKQLQDKNYVSSLKAYTTKHSKVGYTFTPIYPIEVDEDSLKEYRKQVHVAFLFPLDTPLIRKLNKYSFPGECKSHVLVNPHEAIHKPLPPGNEVGLVQGSYGYYHYLQDKIDDNKWGCAYRSLQTLFSWFRMQGYTDKPIPTHTTIQQVLVDIRDKPPSFVGSRQWIGSTEVGFVLETMLHVTSKFIYVSSGAELASKGRELLYHFNTTGTPIMIGGGVLAHTIIGVSWNPSSGDISFLVLDPHYTGGEDITQVLKQGWCAWKGTQFWDSKAYYNLCLPQKPTTY